jgi:hypothetical protein
MVLGALRQISHAFKVCVNNLLRRQRDEHWNVNGSTYCDIFTTVCDALREPFIWKKPLMNAIAKFKETLVSGDIQLRLVAFSGTASLHSGQNKRAEFPFPLLGRKWRKNP